MRLSATCLALCSAFASASSGGMPASRSWRCPAICCRLACAFWAAARCKDTEPSSFCETQPVKGKLFFQAGDCLRSLVCLAGGSQRLVPLGDQLGLRSAIGRPQSLDQVGDPLRAGANGVLHLREFLLGVLECLFSSLNPVFDRLQGVVGNQFFRAMGRRGVFRRAADRASLPLGERQGEARSLAGNPALPGSFKIFPA